MTELGSLVAMTVLLATAGDPSGSDAEPFALTGAPPAWFDGKVFPTSEAVLFTTPPATAAARMLRLMTAPPTGTSGHGATVSIAV